MHENKKKKQEMRIARIEDGASLGRGADSGMISS